MKKILILILTVAALFSVLSTVAFAESEATTLESITPEESNGESAFELVYNEILKHSDKILAALAFIGSVILAFIYKKGLLPIIKGSLSAIGSSVNNLNEAARDASEEAKKRLDAAAKSLEAAEELFNGLSERLDCMKEELEVLLEEKKHSDELKIIVSTQIDMLYEIFMSSSLPMYQKEAVGEKISAMRATLSVGNGAQANE
jgi:hypothetical protein